MATLAQIREGLRANLASISDVQVSAYLLSQPTPPCIEIAPASVEYDLAMQRGADRWTIVVRAATGLTTDRGAQVNLDELLAPTGARSVKTAIEADSTLGGVVDDLRVTTMRAYRAIPRESGGPLLGAEWDVTVIASN